MYWETILLKTILLVHLVNILPEPTLLEYWQVILHEPTSIGGWLNLKLLTNNLHNNKLAS